LPAGTFDVVTDAAVDTAFRLVVIGSRTQAGQTQHRVARWDGSAWTVLGGTFDGPLRSVVVTGAGDVIVGGEFQNHGAQPLSRLARWNGTAWQAIGGGVGGSSSAHVGALCVLPGGDLVVGGTFATAGGTVAANIARWNGTQWQAIGSGQSANLTSIVALSNSELFAAGLNSALPERWDGTAWTQLTGLLPAVPFGAGPWVSKLEVQNGWQGPTMVAVGSFRVGNFPAGIAAWSSFGGWVPLSGSLEGLDAAVPQRLGMATSADGISLAVAGPFNGLGGVDCSGVATTSSGLSSPNGNGIAQPVVASGTLPDGDLVIAGPFRNIGDTLLSGCATIEARAAFGSTRRSAASRPVPKCARSRMRRTARRCSAVRSPRQAASRRGMSRASTAPPGAASAPRPRSRSTACARCCSAAMARCSSVATASRGGTARPGSS
jgi:hypothetical protein